MSVTGGVKYVLRLARAQSICMTLAHLRTGMVHDEPAIAIAARVVEIDSLRVSSPLSAETVPLAPRTLPAPQVCALAQ
eukprot:12916205-Alexandrium_andersonii.AAC.1